MQSNHPLTTTVINLFGGPSTGKSLTAASLYSKFKQDHESVELVREYVKHWAYQKKNIKEYDQIYLLGKQSHYESFLYGTVRYIVTDSPVLLSGFYAVYNNGPISNYVDQAAKGFINHASKNGVKHYNFLLSRDFPYDPVGRYETEDQAIALDYHLKDYLTKFSKEYGQEFAPIQMGSTMASYNIHHWILNGSFPAMS